jgi:hypothetical protein
MGGDVEVINQSIRRIYYSQRSPELTKVRYSPFPGCLKRELKGVVTAWLVGPEPFANDCGWGLPLGNRDDKFIGGGICTLAALGLRRASLAPFIWIALSAGD